MPGTVDHQLTVLFPELAALRTWKQIEHGFRRPAKLHPERRHHDRPIDEDRMSQHCVEQLIIGNSRIVESKIVIRSALHADNIPNGNAHSSNNDFNNARLGRAFQIFNNVRLDAGVADQPERIARRAALGIVIDDNVDHSPALSP